MTSAQSQHRNAASCSHLFSTGNGETRSKLPAHAAPEPGSPRPDAAGARHIASLTLTSAVEPCSRPPRRCAALPCSMPQSP